MFNKLYEEVVRFLQQHNAGHLAFSDPDGPLSFHRATSNVTFDGSRLSKNVDWSTTMNTEMTFRIALAGM